MPYDAFVVDGTQLKVTIAATPTLIQGVQSFSGPTGSKRKSSTHPFPTRQRNSKLASQISARFHFSLPGIRQRRPTLTC